jgi:hypothetical protein
VATLKRNTKHWHKFVKKVLILKIAIVFKYIQLLYFDTIVKFHHNYVNQKIYSIIYVCEIKIAKWEKPTFKVNKLLD